MPKAKQIYQLRVDLQFAKPPIWRRVAVPANITIGNLHVVIQVAMGWQNCHMHQFTFRDKALEPSPAELRRYAAAHEDEWSDEFINRMRGGRVFVDFDVPREFRLPGEDEDLVKLSKVCPQEKCKLEYVYDFGDNWVHIIKVEKIAKADPKMFYPVCLKGKLASPPEDCGGMFGYYEMLDAMKDPTHPEHDSCTEWLGADFDPDRFDIDQVNHFLQKTFA